MKKFLRAIEVAELLGIGRSTVWAWTKQNKLPPAIKLSQKITVWDRAEILQWAENQ